MARQNISDLMVCQAYALAASTKGKWPEEILHERTGEPIKVCLAAMERAEKRGLVDYGVSLHAGWLTEKGKALLG